MNTQNKRTSGFGATGIIVVIVAIALVGLVVWRFYDASTTKTASQTASTSGSQTKADPYTGWQSATLKYEKASFKYPSTWKLTNVSTPDGTTGNITPGSDQAKLVSPTGLTVTMDTGVSGIGDGPYGGTVLSVTPITTLGGHYYLGFGTGFSSSSTMTNGGTVGTTAASSASFLPSKNTSVAGGQPFDVISMVYFDASGSAVAKPVSDFQGDSSYNDALLIIKSLTY